jgi:hypothetical protein
MHQSRMAGSMAWPCELMQIFEMVVLEIAKPLAIGETSAISSQGADLRNGPIQRRRVQPQEKSCL